MTKWQLSSTGLHPGYSRPFSPLIVNFILFSELSGLKYQIFQIFSATQNPIRGKWKSLGFEVQGRISPWWRDRSSKGEGFWCQRLILWDGYLWAMVLKLCLMASHSYPPGLVLEHERGLAGNLKVKSSLCAKILGKLRLVLVCWLRNFIVNQSFVMFKSESS